MDKAFLFREFDKRVQELREFLQKEYWGENLKSKGEEGQQWLDSEKRTFDETFELEKKRLEWVYSTFDKIRAFGKKYSLTGVRRMLDDTEKSRASLLSYGSMVRSSWAEARHLDGIIKYIKSRDLPPRAHHEWQDILSDHRIIKQGLKPFSSSKKGFKASSVSNARVYRSIQWDNLVPTSQDQEKQFNEVGNQEYLRILLQNPELMIGNRLQAKKLLDFAGGSHVFVASLGSNISPAFFYLSHLKEKNQINTPTSLLHADTADKVIEDMQKGDILPPGYTIVPLSNGRQKVMVSSDCFTREGELTAHPQLLLPFLAKLPRIGVHQFKLTYLENSQLASHMKNFLSQRLEPDDLNRLVSFVLKDRDEGRTRIGAVLGRLKLAEKKEANEEVKKWITQFRDHIKGYFDLLEVKNQKHAEALLSAYNNDPDFFKNLKSVFPPQGGDWGSKVQKTTTSVTSKEFVEELKNSFSQASASSPIDKIFVDISFLIHHLPKEEWRPLFSNLALRSVCALQALLLAL